jgi:DNA-binding transcriptional MerR regulator
VSQTSKRESLEGGAHRAQYTVGVVAERIGVPIATLRSWNQRYGIGPHEHSPGRHRLYSENDIVMVEQMHHLIEEGASPRSAARAALDSVVPPRADTDSLLSAAFDLDVGSAERQLESHLRHYGVVDTWDQLIRPVFSAIECKQAGGEACIDVEHALSWAVSRALHRLPITPATSALTILACTERETHTLPLEALRAALGERGHGALMLGADVPPAALIDAIGRTAAPITVVLWAQTADSADVAMAKAAIAESARLMVGGPGWKAVRVPRMAVRVDSLESALELIGGSY